MFLLKSGVGPVLSIMRMQASAKLSHGERQTNGNAQLPQEGKAVLGKHPYSTTQIILQSSLTYGYHMIQDLKKT